MKTKSVLNGFVYFSIIYIIILFFGKEHVAWFLKPFLLLFLIIAVYLQKQFTTKKILLIALTLSWIGDIILMFADHGEIYFIAGLIAFLLSHIFYIILFRKQVVSILNKNKITFWLGTSLIILYLGAMMLILLPNLGDLKIPIFIYAFTISIMLFCALNGFLHWQKPANKYILIGAIFFVTSDSILAFNKFYFPLPNNSFLIMSTYLVAQYLITSGILNLNKKDIVVL